MNDKLLSETAIAAGVKRYAERALDQRGHNHWLIYECGKDCPMWNASNDARKTSKCLLDTMKTVKHPARPAYEEHFCDDCLHFPHDGPCGFGSLNRPSVLPCKCERRESSRKFKALKKRMESIGGRADV